jgi:hypothetical protein
MMVEDIQKYLLHVAKESIGNRINITKLTIYHLNTKAVIHVNHTDFITGLNGIIFHLSPNDMSLKTLERKKKEAADTKLVSTHSMLKNIAMGKGSSSVKASNRNRSSGNISSRSLFNVNKTKTKNNTSSFKKADVNRNSLKNVNSSSLFINLIPCIKEQSFEIDLVPCQDT